MAITTYAELQTAVGNWLNRSDLSSRIPEFIALAEARLSRKIRVPDMLTRNDSFTIDSQYETVPTGFLGAKRFVISGTPVTALEYITPEEMAEKRVWLNSSGKPIYYTVAGGNFEFLPTPATAYTASILYYQAITGLATTSPNWLLTSHPDIYLYASLVAAEPYVMNDERVVLWKAQLDEALAELKVAKDNQSLGGTPVARAKVLGL